MSLKGRHSLGGGPTKGVERDTRRGREGNLEASGQEEADDIFESEFTMLQDLWKFDSVPFSVTKQVRASEGYVGLKFRVHIVLVARSWLATLHPSRNTWDLAQVAITLTRSVLMWNSHAAGDWSDFAQLKGVIMKTAVSTWRKLF